eukprot:2005623-Prymnesium_polylepis.1
MGVCAWRQVLTGSAQASRSGEDRRSRLRGFESRAHLCGQRRCAASSRTPVWHRTAHVSAARARKSKPAV